MTADDNIRNFKGNEAEWAALCALHGMLASAERFHEEQASELIQQVWEFVVETCNVEGLQVPDKELAIQKLKKHINEHFS